MFSPAFNDQVLSLLSGRQIGVRLHDGPPGPIGLGHLLTHMAYTQFSFPVDSTIENLTEVFFDRVQFDGFASMVSLWNPAGGLAPEFILCAPFPEMRLHALDSVSVSPHGFRISLTSIS